MVDLRVGFAVRAVDVQLFARNVFDERAQSTPRFRYFRATEPQVTILQPRTVGLAVSAAF
jgi:hypothetical protein